MMITAKDYLDIYYKWTNMLCEFEEQLTELFGREGLSEFEDYFENLNVDPVDWDGTSLELTECKDGWQPTEEQIQKIFEWGFDGLRIDYKTPLNPSHGMSGDFHRHRVYGEGCWHNTPEKKLD